MNAMQCWNERQHRLCQKLFSTIALSHANVFVCVCVCVCSITTIVCVHPCTSQLVICVLSSQFCGFCCWRRNVQGTHLKTYIIASECERESEVFLLYGYNQKATRIQFCIRHQQFSTLILQHAYTHTRIQQRHAAAKAKTKNQLIRLQTEAKRNILGSGYKRNLTTILNWIYFYTYIKLLIYIP